MTEKSTFVCRGPRRTLRPTLPMSVPCAPAMAVPFELGITLTGLHDGPDEGERVEEVSRREH